MKTTEKRLQQMKEYYKNNRERIRVSANKRGHDYYWNNREKILERRRKQKVWSVCRDKKLGIVRPEQAECHLCGKIIFGNNLCADHSHITGKFRGWLCKACNRSLGWFERRREKILEYVK